MRTLVSWLGTVVLLANLACAALCCAPEKPAPPCHSSSHSQKAAKACDQQSATDLASKLLLPAIESSLQFELAPASNLPLLPAPSGAPRQASPPLILRV